MATAVTAIPVASSLPRIKQLYSTPATPASSPAVDCFPLPSWSRHGHAAQQGRTAPAAKQPTQSHIPRPSNKDGALSSAEALAKYRRILTSYEQEEIKKYPSVYFVGPTARKIEGDKAKAKNFGFDDDKGRYKCVKNDHICYRYEVLKGLGKGSFGDVVKAYDHKTKTHVALKIIRNERRFHKQAQSEIKILDLLRRQDKRDHHNVVHMKDSFLFRGHLCVSFEIMHSDLYCALKKNGFRGFQLTQIRSISASLVTALRVLRRSRIIHCDLKPENILLRSPDSTDVKVIDFGSSCFDHQRVHTYIQSRFYRSPEVIMGLGYGVPIDMWSLGCILAELYTGQPLFPGHDENEQLMYQMQVLGCPPLDLIQRAKRGSSFFTEQGQPKHMTDRKGRARQPGSRALSQAVPCQDPAFLDFIAQCLRWDPAERMTPREAAHHPFVTGRASMDTAERLPASLTVDSAEEMVAQLQRQVDEQASKLQRTQSDGIVERKKVTSRRVSVRGRGASESNATAPRTRGSLSMNVDRDLGSRLTSTGVTVDSSSA